MASGDEECCDIVSLFRGKPKPPAARVVTGAQPSMRHPDNTVTNSRYNLYNFIPKNLYEQFRRPLNAYFLFVALLQFLPSIAPVNPLSTFLPLALAFTLTAVKEALDDIVRHRSDNAYNAKHHKVLRSTGWTEIASGDIRVGDLVLVRDGDAMPCDCVALATEPDKHGTVFLLTDNLDGESDLKVKKCVLENRPSAAPPLSPSTHTDTWNVEARKMKIDCQAPEANIYRFCGAFEWDVGNETLNVPLDASHLLLQSCTLKNTPTVVAMAVYTGEETRSSMNKRAPKPKRSQVDERATKYSVALFAMQMVTAITLGIAAILKSDTLKENDWYLVGAPQLGPNSDSSSLYEQDFGNLRYIIYPLRFFLLTTVMIPISFKMLVDVSKYYIARTLEWDDTMKEQLEESADPFAHAARARGRSVTSQSNNNNNSINVISSDAPSSRGSDDGSGSVEKGVQGCVVKNSSGVEDLGQIGIVVSDKTGTLTQNIMEYRAVVGIDSPRISTGTGARPPGEWDTLLCALLCSNATVEDGSFHSPSPDEVALCAGAHHLGFELVSRTGNIVKIKNPNCGPDEITYRIEATFPFTSERKCMTVLVKQVTCLKDPSQQYALYVKGADDRVLGMSLSDPRAPTLTARIDEYASKGYRTLCMARRFIDGRQLNELMQSYEAAQHSVATRDALMEQLYLQYERDMTLLGATAVEDRLQTGVQETISACLAANIKFWMITGDKRDTARQIAVACNLFPPNLRVFPVRGASVTSATAAGLHPSSASVGGYTENIHNNDRILFDFSDVREWEQLLIDATQHIETVARTKQASTASAFGSKVKGECRTALYDDLVDQPFMTDRGPPPRYFLLVTGAVIALLFADEKKRKQFHQVAIQCDAVVCARVSPSQKAEIAALVRHGGLVTLAIGDGGNDVAMIQTANVGVGIAGKEGSQASRAADFSITQFRHLHTLLFVHGQMSYRRTCFIIQYSFYKSMLIAFVQLYYNLAGGALSGVSFWGSYFLTMWNGAFTLPQAAAYCLDRFAPRSVLERYPALYRDNQEGLPFQPSTFARFLITGVVQSTLIGYMTTDGVTDRPTEKHGGRMASEDDTGTIAYNAMLLLQVFYVLLHSNSLSLYNWLAIIVTPLLYVAATATYSGAFTELEYYGVFVRSFQPGALLSWIWMAAAFGGIEAAVCVVMDTYFPDRMTKLRRRLRNKAPGRAKCECDPESLCGLLPPADAYVVPEDLRRPAMTVVEGPAARQSRGRTGTEMGASVTVFR